MKTGFTLIELIIALMLSSIVISVLFASFFYVNRSTRLADEVVSFDTRSALIQHQLQKDIAGAFIPVQGQQEVEKKEEKKAPQKEKVDKEKKEKDEKAKKATKQKPKKVSAIFVSSNKGNIFSELTFITTNPLRVYEYAKNTPVLPRIVRVVYRLVMNDDKKSYRLMRQEGKELNYDSYKGASPSIKAYEVINFIKDFKITYKYPKEETSKKKEKKSSVEFEQTSEWQSDTRQKENVKPIIPQYIECELTLWDAQYETERAVNLFFEVSGFAAMLDIKETSTKKEESSKEEKEKKAKDEKTKKDQQQKTTVAMVQKKPTVTDIENAIKEISTLLNKSV